MTPRRRAALSRRTFLADLGRGSFAIAVVGVAACAPASTVTPEPATSTGASTPTSPGATVSDTPEPATATGTATTRWERVDLGFVSAYILVQDGEAAIVDTGVAGSEGAIGESLKAVGLDWPAVGNVILTHHHGDHAGSAEAILGLAANAAIHAGTLDIPSIRLSRDVQPLEDGDTVMGLQIVATPGHTAGHISVLDPVDGVLVAGDALNTSSGALSGSPPAFTSDAIAATASVVKLGTLTFETLLPGHGEPIPTGASGQIAAFAATL